MAGHLARYKVLPGGTPASKEALQWPRGNAAVLERGLMEAITLFHSRRPQTKEG